MARGPRQELSTVNCVLLAVFPQQVHHLALLVKLVDIHLRDHPSAHLALLESQRLDQLQVVRLSLLAPSAHLAMQEL